MKKYTLVIKKKAEKQLAKLPKQVTEKLLNVITSLCADPRPRGYIKLVKRKGYRIRKGDYRIIYNIEDEKIIVTVLQVGHRQNVYND